MRLARANAGCSERTEQPSTRVFTKAGQPGWQRSILIPQQRSLGLEAKSHPHPHVSVRFGCQPDWRCPRTKVSTSHSLLCTIVLLPVHLIERPNPSSRLVRNLMQGTTSLSACQPPSIAHACPSFCVCAHGDIALERVDLLTLLNLSIRAIQVTDQHRKLLASFVNC
jgi:hypothetical protein